MNCTTQRQIKVLTTGSNECSFHLEIGPLELHSSENEVLKVGPNPICLSVLIRGGKAIGKQRHRGGMHGTFPEDKKYQRSVATSGSSGEARKDLPSSLRGSITSTSDMSPGNCERIPGVSSHPV